VTQTIVERFDLSIPDGQGIKGADGRDYSWFGIGLSVLAIPFYIIGKYISSIGSVYTVSIIGLLIGAATAVLVFLSI
jgi:uncharacterized membrane protein